MNGGPSAWSLLYVADPMCSWCYGFAPALAAVRARRPELPVELLMGGLRREGEPLDGPLRDKLQQHWTEVARRSGQPFSPAGLQREDWTYTTEPACRAVVTVRHLARGHELDMLKAIQSAFYAEGRDVTGTATLADLAAAIGIDRDAFLKAFDRPAIRAATIEDFALAQRLGITGFPALAVVRDGQGRLIAPGWVAPADLLERLERVLAA